MTAVLVLLALLAGTASAAADGRPPDDRPPILRDVGLDQRLGATLPLDAVFRDADGETAPLRHWLRGRPVVLNLVYFKCPMLCGQVTEGLVAALRTLPLDVGRDFDVLTVSFDPRDDVDAATAKRAEILSRYRRPDAASGWHVLTGDADGIRRLTDAVGFRYAWDDAGRQFAHVAVVAVVTPDGRVARYFPGIDYPTRDLRLALVEASEGRIGTVVDRLLLFCYHWDAATGRYTAAVGRALQVGGALTVVALGTLIVVLRRHEGRAA